MVNMRKPVSVFVLAVAMILAGWVALRQAQSAPPSILWTPTNVTMVATPGANFSTQISFTNFGNQALNDITIEPVPELARFLTLKPSNFTSVQPGQFGLVTVSVAIPQGTALATYDGTIHVRQARQTLPRTLKISINVTSNAIGLILSIPNGFQIDSQVLALGGPIALNNFGNQYQRGGIVPPGGAEIHILSIPLPAPPLSNFITNELQGATITSTSNIAVSGNSCTETFYTDSFGPTLTYNEISVYCPLGGILYKFNLAYRGGDALEAQFLTSFQQILTTTQFTP